MSKNDALRTQNNSLLDALARFPPFQNLSGTARTLLNNSVVIKNPSRADGILYKGQPVSGAYFVLRGRLRVFTIAPSGTEATLYFLDPGETCVLRLIASSTICSI